MHVSAKSVQVRDVLGKRPSLSEQMCITMPSHIGLVEYAATKMAKQVEATISLSRL